MSETNRYWLAFLFCSLVAALPLLATYRLPMTDLPQHAAQLTLWKFYDADCYDFRRLYERNWFTPYILGYAVTRLFSTVLMVNGALKLTIFLSIVALPLSVRSLLARAGLDPWLSLLMFPLAYGFSFYWGFLNFMVAIPLAVLFLSRVYDYSFEQDAGRGLILTLLAALLLLSHALIFVSCIGIALVFQLLRWRQPRRLLLSSIPFLLLLPPMFWWIVRMQGSEQRFRAPTVWNFDLLRPLNLASHLLASHTDLSAVGFSLLMMVLLALSGLRPAQDIRRWIAAAGFGLAYLFGPSKAFGTSFIYQRFAIFFFIFLLFAFEARRPVIRASAVRLLLTVLVSAWMVLLTARFYRFGRDAADFDRIVDSMRTNSRVLLLNAAPWSDAVPGLPFWHFAGYYQERKGGLIGWSFSSNFPVLMRYRKGVDPGTAAVGANPTLFNWQRHSQFDYFLLRAPEDQSRAAFATATEPVSLRARQGWWWLYERTASTRRDPSMECPPLEPDTQAVSSEKRESQVLFSDPR